MSCYLGIFQWASLVGERNADWRVPSPSPHWDNRWSPGKKGSKGSVVRLKGCFFAWTKDVVVSFCVRLPWNLLLGLLGWSETSRFRSSLSQPPLGQAGSIVLCRAPNAGSIAHYRVPLQQSILHSIAGRKNSAERHL